jgi:hypothetical protein
MVPSRILAYLQQETPFGKDTLCQIIESAPTRYKNHYIKKRNNRGLRLISQPTREVKLLQRSIVKLLDPLVKIHDTATAYQKGRSIKDHATPHAANRYLLKLDFKDFFPSIDQSCLEYCIHNIDLFSKEESEQIIKILCRLDFSTHPNSLRLSIGAPSSPFISNFVMYEFDDIVNSFCAKNNAIYTRYADDIAISCSTPKFLDKTHAFINSTLTHLDYLKITLNDEKTVYGSKKNKRFLVGIVLANSGTASIGRDAKRAIRATIHKASKGLLNIKELSKLRGRLSYYLSIDKEFVTELLRRYGFDSPNKIVFPVIEDTLSANTNNLIEFHDDDLF